MEHTDSVIVVVIIINFFNEFFLGLRLLFCALFEFPFLPPSDGGNLKRKLAAVDH